MRNFVMTIGLVVLGLVASGCVTGGYVVTPTVVVNDGPDVVVVRYQNPTTLLFYDYPAPNTVIVYGRWNHVHGSRIWVHDPGYRPGPHRHGMIRERHSGVRHRGGNISRSHQSERRVAVTPSSQRGGHGGGSREVRPNRQGGSGRGNAQRQAERPTRPRKQRDRR